MQLQRNRRFWHHFPWEVRGCVGGEVRGCVGGEEEAVLVRDLWVSEEVECCTRSPGLAGLLMEIAGLLAAAADKRVG